MEDGSGWAAAEENVSARLPEPLLPGRISERWRGGEICPDLPRRPQPTGAVAGACRRPLCLRQLFSGIVSEF